MAGVELDAAVGKNNGSVKGVVYFQCAPNHGLLVRPWDMKVGIAMNVRMRDHMYTALYTARDAVRWQRSDACGGLSAAVVIRCHCRLPSRVSLDMLCLCVALARRCSAGVSTRRDQTAQSK